MVSSALFVIALGLFGTDEPVPVVQPASLEAPQAAAVVPTVIVKGHRPRRRIDRERYDIGQDAASQSGTVADALRRVPSVAVDANGRVYLRGRTNVQVYINGQPSTLMGADVRGLVLNAMPSNWVSAIELITIPNAGMAKGDGAPIINLITNPNRKPGGFASGEVSINGSGQTGVNLTGSYGGSRLTVNGGLSLRDDRQVSASETRIETFDGARVPLSLSQAQNSLKTRTHNESFNGGLTFTPNALNSFSAQLVLTHSSRSSEGRLLSLSTDGAGLTQGLYDQVNHQSDDSHGQDLTLNWTYSDLDDGETLKLNLNDSRSKSPARALDQFRYRVPMLDQSQAERLSNNSTAMTILSLDYERPFGEGLVTTGLNYSQTRANASTQATGEGVIDNGLLSNQSDDLETVSAIYGTYQRPFGERWVVQAGLRAEAYRIGSSQEGGELKDRYTHWTPSLFVLYQAQPTTKWRLAYSRQQQSASLQARNPRLVYQDAQTLNQGNPNLKAQTTDSFELSYDRFGEKGATQVRLFYTPTRDVVVPVTRLLADGVVARRQENGGSGYGLGFDVNTGRQLTNKLNLQLQLGVTRNSRDAQNGEHEQATALSGQAILNYGLSDKDNIALTYMVQGSGLTGQGTSKPFSTSSINYSHSFSPKLTLTIDVQNPLGKGTTRQLYETPTLITSNESRSENRIVMFTLRSSFVRFEP